MSEKLFIFILNKAHCSKFFYSRIDGKLYMKYNDNEVMLKKFFIKSFVWFLTIFVGVSLMADNLSNIESLSSGINRFSFSLYRHVSLEDEDNVIFSPMSIYFALSILYSGARGDTQKQMEKTLCLKIEQKRVPSEVSLFSRNIFPQKSKTKSILKMANAIWVQKGFKLLKNYKSIIMNYYNTILKEVNFLIERESVVNEINRWVYENTNGKIKNILNQGDIDSLVRLVLTNAIYFKGIWKHRFKEKNTVMMPFFVSPKREVKVMMMRIKEKFPYYSDGNIKVIELPYSGDEISMVVFLPEKGQIKRFESELTYEKFEYFLKNLKTTRVKVSMPKFKIDKKYYLEKTLAKMGMEDAFSKRADFSKIDGRKDLFISKVIHQAYIDVNEEGTEAAGSTVITMRLTSVLNEPEFKADHPFLFTIIHKKTKTILFMGRVKNPL